MATIKNKTGEDRLLPWLGDRLVLAGQVVDVPDDDVYAYTQQEGWEPVDEAARTRHEHAHAADEATAKVLAGHMQQPAGNAAKGEWLAWVVGSSRAPASAAARMSRDELREAYGVHEEESEPRTARGPRHNASRSDWFDYVVGTGLAAPEALDGLSRDEIRDTYGTKENQA